MQATCDLGVVHADTNENILTTVAETQFMNKP